MKNILSFLMLLLVVSANSVNAQYTLYSPNSETVPNGDFSSGTTGWTITGNWTSSNGAILYTNNSNSTNESSFQRNLPSNGIVVHDGYFFLEFDIMMYTHSNTSTLNLFLRLGATDTVFSIYRSKTGNNRPGDDRVKIVDLKHGALLASPVGTWNSAVIPNNTIFETGSTKIRLRIPQRYIGSSLRFIARASSRSSSSNYNAIMIDNINIVNPTSYLLSSSCDTCFSYVIEDTVSNSPVVQDARPIVECKTNSASPYTYTYYLPAVADLPHMIDYTNSSQRNTAIKTEFQITSEAAPAQVKIHKLNGATNTLVNVAAGENISIPMTYDDIFMMYPDTNIDLTTYDPSTNTNYNNVYKNRGFVVESNQPITLRWIANYDYNRLAVVLRNTDVLGRAFRAASVLDTRNSGEYEGKHYITVMATEDNTLVQVGKTPTAKNDDDFEIIELDKYEQKTILSDVPVSGRLILANKPITAISGQQHKRIDLGYVNTGITTPNDNYPSHAQEGTIIQLKPLYALSKEHLTIINGATSSLARGGFQVVAVEDNTEVRFDNTLVAILNAGESYQQMRRFPSIDVGSGKIIKTNKRAYVYDIGSNPLGEFEMYTAPALDQPLGKSSMVKVFNNQGSHGWVVVDPADYDKLKRNDTAIANTGGGRNIVSTLAEGKRILYFNGNFAPNASNTYECIDCKYMYVGQMNDGAEKGSQVGYVSSFDGAPLQFYNTELLPALILTNGYVIDTINYHNHTSGKLSHKLTIASTGGTQVIIDSIVLSRTGGKDPGSINVINNPNLEFTLNTPPSNTLTKGTKEVVNATVYVNDGVQNAAICLSYVLMNFTPLPVTLTSFEAVKENETAVVTWETANERDNKGFLLQRSKDGKNWQDLTWVDSKSENGISDIVNNYEYIDTKPFDGKNFYRLMQLDYNNQSSYSSVRVVEFSGLSKSYFVYPNPTENSITIEGLEIGSKITVHSGTGQYINEFKANDNKLQIDLSQFAAGIYTIMITDSNGEIHYERIIKK